MIFDALEFRPEGVYDFCIVGSGPAGITLALSLARAKKRVLLLEAGGEAPTADSQDIYKGEVKGDEYFPLHTARLRCFGGTSYHWTGMCRPLDDVDFEFQPYRPKASWPIDKPELDTYFGAAKEIFEIDSLPADRTLSDGSLEEIGFAFAPVRFGQKYRATIGQSANLSLVLNANVTALRTNGNAITSAEVSTWAGRQFAVRARTYVLATGGIENSRILLWSNHLSNGSLVPKGTPVGERWMEHPHETIGDVLLVGADPFRRLDNQQAYLSPTRKAQIEDESLNCGLRLTAKTYEGTKAMIANLACVAPDTATWVAKLFGQNLVCGLMLRAAWEQEPVPSNRIELSNDLDRFGMPRVKLHWKKSEYDIRTARKAAERFGIYLTREGLGRVRLLDRVLYNGPPEFKDEIGGFHHMGGTRMAESARDGVVDRNCKVFGQENLYVAGSSVFPSGGLANPTFTIVQISLRLANHLLRT